MRHEHIDGKRLFYAFSNGRKKVIRKLAHLNRINVFPVADGDTGTNLASTMQSIIKRTRIHSSVSELSRGMADAALAGSRGNSGIIFAQFVHGFSEALKDKTVLRTKDFAQAVHVGVERAYQALSKPVEGTILTVMKAWAGALHRLHSRTEDFSEMLHHSLDAARQALKDTPNKLKVLRMAGVVDAGAEGFMHFIEGVAESFSHETMRFDEEDEDIESFFDFHESEQGLTYRYCTEVLLHGQEMDLEAIRKEIAPFGDSCIVAGSPRQAKVHVHTNTPALLVDRLRHCGEINEQKVDDMRRQFEALHHRKSSIALVTDSSCDLPQEILDFHQIHVVPLHLTVGPNQFLDKLTMDSDRFYTLLDESPSFPKTSQPTVRTFDKMYRFLLEQYDAVISIHLSGALSGTLNAAQKAAEPHHRKPIAVLDSKQLSTTLGLIVLRVAEAIESGAGFKEAVALAESLVERTKILVSVPTLKYMVRGGRVSPLKGLLAKALNLKPIVTLREGKSELQGKAFSVKANQKKILKQLEEIHRRSPIRRIALGHAHNPVEADSFRKEAERRLGVGADFLMDISPTIGAHAGVGAISISVLWE